MVQNKGDVGLPSEGDLVVFGRLANGQSIVLGSLYSRESSVPDYQPDERTIGIGDAEVKLTESGAIRISTGEENLFLNGDRVEQGLDNSLSVPHTEWHSSLDETEIWRTKLKGNEKLRCYRLELRLKGGKKPDPRFTIELIDLDTGSVITSTSSTVQGDPVGESSYGANVVARITNDRGFDHVAAISSKLSIIKQ